MAAIAELDILIVDDHEAMRALLRKVLERAGATRLRDAADGAAALALLSERRADLILADQSMPGMDGVTFIARARAGGTAARIIMVTGHADARHAEAAGANAVLVKPVTPRALLEAIEALFG